MIALSNHTKYLTRYEITVQHRLCDYLCEKEIAKSVRYQSLTMDYSQEPSSYSKSACYQGLLPCSRQVNIRMCSLRLIWLDDNKSPACKLLESLMQVDLSRLFVHKLDTSCFTTCSKSANAKLHQVRFSQA